MPKVELRLPSNFPAKQRRRAGVVVPSGRSVQAEVSAEALEELKADGQIQVKVLGDEKPLDRMKKAELLEVVEAEGVEGVDESTTNKDLVKAIEASRE